MLEEKTSRNEDRIKDRLFISYDVYMYYKQNPTVR